ncbi:class I SAM-dependent methyltransferase [Candidatus Micrarchaeota archaeon]|nr:class I SAM-dependent methyltransferase [Candidatus Micrarchaeota archaeon]
MKEGKPEDTKWNRYTRSMGKKTAFPKEFLKEYCRKKRTLDIGCGRGGHARYVSGFAKKVYGIDPSDEAIAEAKSVCPKCKFFVGSAYKLPFKDNFFDSVYSIDVIEHLDYPEKMLKEVKRVLKKGGVFLIQTPNYPVKRFYDLIHYLNPNSWRKTFDDDPTHVSKFSYGLLKETVEKYFRIEKAFCRNLFLDSKIKKLETLRDKSLGLYLGQKIIMVLRKE